MINVVLYEPEIPQNTGNIMRLCAGTGMKLHLIKPLGFDLSEKSIKRSGANNIEKCEYVIYENYEEFISKNKGTIYYITRYGKKPHSEPNYKLEENIYFVFGKESTGIPKEILKENVDNCLRIPANGNVRSLNLSNCVAIVTYESLRQMGYPGLSTKEVFKGEDYIIN